MRRAEDIPFLTMENATKTAVLCGRDTVQVRPPKPLELQLEKLAKDLDGSGYLVKFNPFLLSCEKAGERIVIFKDGGSVDSRYEGYGPCKGRVPKHPGIMLIKKRGPRFWGLVFYESI